MDRHGRQARLEEVGALGQARIGRAVVDVRLDGLAADVAARYLAGAGVAAVRVRDEKLAEGARALAPGVRVQVEPMLAVEDERRHFGISDPACRDLARGAHAALLALRAVLDGTSPVPGAWSKLDHARPPAPKSRS
jgi:hypothetical protein